MSSEQYKTHSDVYDPQKIISEFNQRLTTGLQQTIAEYRQQHGNYISADTARELSMEYAQSRESCTALTGATQSGATKIAEAIFMDAIQCAENDGKTVIFTSGGSGVGKTTVIEDVAKINAAI